MSRKSLPTLERHKEIGAELQKTRNFFVHLGSELSRHYPKRIYSTLDKACQYIDKLRSLLDNEVCKMNGENSELVRIYYPPYENGPMFISGRDLMQEPIYPDRLTKRISFCKNGVTIDGNYFIGKNRINTVGKLMCWVTHLLSKSWVDAEFMSYFIEVVATKYDLDVYDGGI